MRCSYRIFLYLNRNLLYRNVETDQDDWTNPSLLLTWNITGHTLIWSKSTIESAQWRFYFVNYGLSHWWLRRVAWWLVSQSNPPSSFHPPKAVWSRRNRPNRCKRRPSQYRWTNFMKCLIKYCRRLFVVATKTVKRVKSLKSQLNKKPKRNRDELKCKEAILNFSRKKGKHFGFPFLLFTIR